MYVPPLWRIVFGYRGVKTKKDEFTNRRRKRFEEKIFISGVVLCPLPFSIVRCRHFIG